jgi:hypothetical protein
MVASGAATESLRLMRFLTNHVLVKADRPGTGGSLNLQVSHPAARGARFPQSLRIISVAVGALMTSVTSR